MDTRGNGFSANKKDRNSSRLAGREASRSARLKQLFCEWSATPIAFLLGVLPLSFLGFSIDTALGSSPTSLFTPGVAVSFAGGLIYGFFFHKIKSFLKGEK